MTPETYRNFCCCVVPQQITPNFRIKPIPNTQRNLMIHCINTTAAARYAATVLETKTKRVNTWQHWNTFLHSIGVTPVYLDGISRYQQNIIMSGFAQAVTEDTFSKGNYTNLVEGTVSTTLAHEAQVIRTNNRHDPRLDHDGQTCHTHLALPSLI